MPFEYVAPASLAAAVDLLAARGGAARALAGGTDLLVRMHSGAWRPGVVVDLKRIRELSGAIVDTGATLRIGALTTMARVCGDGTVARVFPALADAAAVVGSVQIRNRATVAGNICMASPAGDTAPPLLVYNAVVHLAGPHGARSVPLNEFFTGPGTSVRRHDEIMTSIELPLGPHTGGAWLRVSRRTGLDLSSVSVACLLERTGAVRFAFGAVGPTPFLVRDESDVWGDETARDHQRDAALERIVAHCRPITDIRAGSAYRRAMALVLARRALVTARERLHRSLAS